MGGGWVGSIPIAPLTSRPGEGAPSRLSIASSTAHPPYGHRYMCCCTRASVWPLASGHLRVCGHCGHLKVMAAEARIPLAHQGRLPHRPRHQCHAVLPDPLGQQCPIVFFIEPREEITSLGSTTLSLPMRFTTSKRAPKRGSFSICATMDSAWPNPWLHV